LSFRSRSMSATRVRWQVTSLLLCHLCVGLNSGVAQECESAKLQSTISKMEQDLGSGQGPVRLHRVERLEESIFVPPTGDLGVDSPFHIYQVEQRRFVLADGKAVENVPAGSFSEYVALSSNGDHAYRFAGFPNSENDFRRLISDYHLPSPRGREQAQTRALYCAQVVFGIEPKEWILGEGEARMRVAEQFVDPSAANPFAEAERRWKNFRREYPRVNVVLKTDIGEDGTYLTHLPVFVAAVEGPHSPPEIRELKIQVKQDGSCHLLTDTSSQHK